MTTKEISQKTGVSLRQLQWWDENGLVRATIRGHLRQYEDWQVRLIGIVTELRNRNIGLQMIGRAKVQLTGIAKDLNGTLTYLAFVHRKVPQVLASTEPEKVVEFAAAAGGPVTVVELKPIADEKPPVVIDLRDVADGVGEALRKNDPFMNDKALLKHLRR